MISHGLVTMDSASPLRVGGGSRWAPPGVRQVGGTGACVRRVCARSAPAVW